MLYFSSSVYSLIRLCCAVSLSNQATLTVNDLLRRTSFLSSTELSTDASCTISGSLFYINRDSGYRHSDTDLVQGARERPVHHLPLAKHVPVLCFERIPDEYEL